MKTNWVIIQQCLGPSKTFGELTVSVLTNILISCNEPNLLDRLKCYFLMLHKCSLYAIEHK